MNNLKGELSVMDNLGIKPNYAALGRKYGMDWRTVKKYHNGYEGRPITRNKKSKLDKYKAEITDKLKLNYSHIWINSRTKHPWILYWQKELGYVRHNKRCRSKRNNIQPC